MNIVVVEDDPDQAESLLIELSAGIPSLEIRWYHSVTAFLSAFPELDRDPPVFFILDLMICWRKPEDVYFPKPEELGAPDVAGIFLANQIRKVEALRSTPIVIWTVIELDTIDTNELDSTTRLICKSDYSMRDMTNRIRSILIAGGVDLPTTSKCVRKLADSINLRPGAFGVSVDIKQVYSALKPKKKRN